jgi:hypothetical protein
MLSTSVFVKVVLDIFEVPRLYIDNTDISPDFSQ